MYNLNINFTRLLILGNGFDLNLKLKTSYTNFIESQIFSQLETRNDGLLKFLKDKIDIKEWIDLEIELKTFAKYYRKTEGKEDFFTLGMALKQYLNTITYESLNQDADSYKLIKSIMQSAFLIMDFNYTGTTKKILRDLGVPDDIINKRLIKIHGSLEENDIVIGVEDNADIKPENVFFKKSAQPNFKGINLLDYVDNIEEIYFFGHSLGETDSMYFTEFFQRLCVKGGFEKSKKIFSYYYDIDAYYKLMTRIDRLTGEKLSKLRQYHEYVNIPINNK